MITLTYDRTADPGQFPDDPGLTPIAIGGGRDWWKMIAVEDWGGKLARAFLGRRRPRTGGKLE